MSWFRRDGEDLLLWLKVQPKSSHDGFAEVLDGARKVRITAPPTDGKANKHLAAWLARQFGVAKSAVVLESGETQSRKRVRIVSPRKTPQGIES